MKRGFPRAALAAVVLTALAACQGAGEFPGLSPFSGDGATLYKDNCMACHGAGGRGDGVLAPNLPTPPADLTQLAVRNGGVFPRDRVILIVHGIPGQAHAGVMPDFGERLSEGKKVTYTLQSGEMIRIPRGLIDIAEYLETLQTP